jgi:TPP-dependent pyruvate/acetoin dehydrogenase alpha subunit
MTGVELLRRMLLIREFDSRLPELYTSGLVRGSSHAAIGQEAVAVGACAALRPEDRITSTHRGHGHAIAKGCDIGRMMAELLGRVDGYCRGKGGSMHIADFSIGMLGANGIVGGGIPIAAGAALASSLREDGTVTLCFFGEGALNQGIFHEAANLAGLWRLPVVFLCENNQFAMSARPETVFPVSDLAVRAAPYGFDGVNVDGMDVVAVRDTVAGAVERARAGEGPTLVVATCYRLAGHFSGDTLSYRPPEEAAAWEARDPISAYAAALTAAGELTPTALEAFRAEARDEISRALDFALQSPLPDPEEAWQDVHA